MLKEVAEVEAEVADLPPEATVSEAFHFACERHPKLAEFAGKIVLAHNQRFATPSTRLTAGDEVALLPPVSGGDGFYEERREFDGNWVTLTERPLDEGDMMRKVATAVDGAVALFSGIVRNNSGGRRTRYLEYEAYRGLALDMLEQLGREMLTRHAITRIAMEHRLGRLEIGESSVMIAVASPHRKAAFAACHAAIDKLKATVPIWKKEYFEDGECWVEGQWDESLLSRSQAS